MTNKLMSHEFNKKNLTNQVDQFKLQVSVGQTCMPEVEQDDAWREAEVRDVRPKLEPLKTRVDN